MITSGPSRLEEVRSALLKLPRATETVQWGSNLVFWTMDKAVGGKMFALAELEDISKPVLAFAAGPQRAPLLLEHEGIRPAPYLARAHWVALDRWDALPLRTLLTELEMAHTYVCDRLPRSVQRTLELPLKDYRAAVKQARAEAGSHGTHRRTSK